MSDFGHGVLDALLSSPLLSVGTRRAAMRALGYSMQADTRILAGARFMSKRFSMGADVFVDVGFFYDGCAGLRIGDHVHIGQFVTILTDTQDIGPHAARGAGRAEGQPVEIGDCVWIGPGATILGGVTVESACLIAAFSVVTDDTTRDGFYAGNPARLVRRATAGRAPPLLTLVSG